MKKGQMYVVQCIKGGFAHKFLFGEGTYKKGDYVTITGRPTKSINDAYVYRHGTPSKEFHFDDEPHLEKHFAVVPVQVEIIPLSRR